MLLLSPLVIQAKSFPEFFFDISDRLLAERKEWLLEKWLQGTCGVVHDVKMMLQIVPLSTCEIAFLLGCLRVGFWIQHS